MANFKYFIDRADGSTVTSARAMHDGGSAAKAANFSIFVDGRWTPATRMVRYKSSPSRHVCNARCMNASGRDMACECSCGGANHGKGAQS